MDKKHIIAGHCRFIHSYMSCRMNMHTYRWNPASSFLAEANAWQPLRLARDAINFPVCTTTGNWIRMHVLDLRTRRKKKEKGEQRANVGKRERERQAENEQPYRQTVGRLILLGVHPPATPSKRLRGMRSIPSRVINNIWRLVFPNEAVGTGDGGGAREVRVWG